MKMNLVLARKVAVISTEKRLCYLNHGRSFQIRAEKKDFDSKQNGQSAFDKAALDFKRGIEAGLSEDEIVLLQMGVTREDELTAVQKQYKVKFTEKLKERVKELKKNEKKCLAFEAGKSAYGKGEYSLSCEYLEQGAVEHSEGSLLGADIRMWLALAYQAVGQVEDCIALYKRLSEIHPSKKIIKQAQDLLYIMEAPKLELGEDEKVKLPVLKNLDRPSSRASSVKGISSTKTRKRSKRELSFEESFWESYSPPSVKVPNKYILAASITLCILLLCYVISNM